MNHKFKIGEIVEYLAADNTNNNSYQIVADKETPYISELGGIVIAHKDYVVIKAGEDIVRYIHVTHEQIKRK